MLDETHEPLLVYRARGDAPVGIAFRSVNKRRRPEQLPFAARWLTYAPRPTLRTCPHAGGFDAVSYSIIVVDFHHLLPAGLPAHLTVPFCTELQWHNRCRPFTASRGC